MRKGDVCFVLSPQFGGVSGHGQNLKNNAVCIRRVFTHARKA